MSEEITFFVLIFFAIVFLLCCVCCCACLCAEEDQVNQNRTTNYIDQTNSTPIVRREIYVITINEITSTEDDEQENQRTNEIPPEYSNIKPQETVNGWRQGSGITELPTDARVPANAQPPIIFEDD